MDLVDQEGMPVGGSDYLFSLSGSVLVLSLVKIDSKSGLSHDTHFHKGGRKSSHLPLTQLRF